MAPSPCAACNANRAVILRPKNLQKLCKACFIDIFEAEVHRTITSNSLFRRGERVAIGASGGKDSTVLASVLKTLNERYDYGLDLVLLSVDEGIKGYRDDSLETVKRNAQQYDLPLTIVGYDQLYGWTMDQVVEQVGKKGNCTYCGVFRRQALDRGAAKLGVGHVVTGHNADDVAETVLMNLLRGDLPRLSRTTSIITSTPSTAATPATAPAPVITNIKRSKPLKYAYEKEIVLYAHHKRLDYFSTECIYSPEAFRGSARALVKNLERIRPSAILDIVRSGEDMALLVPGGPNDCARECTSKTKQAVPASAEDEEIGGCGSAKENGNGGELVTMEKRLIENAQATSHGLEVDVTEYKSGENESGSSVIGKSSKDVNNMKQHKRYTAPRKIPQQTMGRCARCGYLSSQAVCKACVLLEGLNKNRPKASIGVEPSGDESYSGTAAVSEGVRHLQLAGD